MPACICPRSGGERRFEFLNRPEDGTCDWCGSLDGDTFMARLVAGDVILTPTDKNYKAYVKNDGGAPFKQTYRTDQPSKPGEIMKDPMDQVQWVWSTREMNETKFYFEHLSEEQRVLFVELLNAKKIKVDVPGYFYRLPFFVTDANAIRG